MEVYVILTDGEGEKGMEESNDVSDTMTRFWRVGVIGCDLY